ncbi:hypothetical protein [Haladaptatus cibarius]|uniref:hypothetical protein n=1 Tax=Haladaptatus cibarius TaxID=453847 RepID=UPI0006797F44|nr:hypothetical protein [Haladaptatus cibarius]
MDAQTLTAGNGAVVRIALYLLVFWPTVGYYVYWDSVRREQNRPIARGIAVGFLGLAGLMLYVFRRDYSNR